MRLKQEDDDFEAGAQNGSKPENRRFVPATQENIADERPSIYTRQFNLSNSSVFSELDQMINQKFDDRKDEENFFYPFITKQERGITRSQVRSLIEGQINTKSLDYVTVPYIKQECISNSEFDSITEYREFCIGLVSDEDKGVVLAYHYKSQPVVHRDFLNDVDFVCMHVGMNYLHTYFDKLEPLLVAFIENSELPVIGYGIPSKVGVHSTGEMKQISDWIPTLDLFYFSEKGVPVGGGSGSDETSWFTLPSNDNVKTVVNLPQSEIDAEKNLDQLFEEYPSAFSDFSPSQIKADSELEEKYMNTVIENWAG